ncbi:MAG TPA: hypothetical protein VFR93_08895 [Candidatus Limnocylindrales bacterium]|nr:hypothetical protein [Candidatus Limnocylindrales bacterium]
MTTPRTPRVDRYGVVDPLALPPAADAAIARLRRMPPLFWLFVVLALVEVALETRALAPLSVDSLLGSGSRVLDILSVGATVLLPSAVLYGRPTRRLGDRLLLGTALVAVVPPLAMAIDTFWRDTPPAPGIDPVAGAYGFARLVIPAIGWLLLASAVRPEGLSVRHLQRPAVAVGIAGLLGAVLSFILDVVVASNIAGANLPEGTFDAPSYLAFSALASVASLGLVAFAIAAIERVGLDASREARLAAVAAALLALRTLPGPAVALTTIAMGASQGYDTTWAYGLVSIAALAALSLLLVALGAGYPGGASEETAA